MPGNLRIAVLFAPSDNTGTPQAEGGRVHHQERRKRVRNRRWYGPERREKIDREQVAEALRANGYDCFLHEVRDEASLLALAKTDADLVFNMLEAYAGDDAREPQVAGFLDLLELRYTGAGPQALFLAQDKPLAKKIFDFHGIRTPRFASSYRGKLDHVDDLEFPLIVKPASEDGSVGIDAGAVVRGLRELMERISMIQEKFDSPALIEEYIEGRELYVGVLGNEKAIALPIVEMDLSKLPEGTPKIAGAEVKWEEDTEAYKTTWPFFPDDLDEDVIKRVQDTALQAFQALQLRDYGRIDFRLAKDGTIHVLEVNPNPYLLASSELALAAKKSGRSYTELIQEITELALARYGPRSA
jgi:D-alanine-D-alanine ligase